MAKNKFAEVLDLIRATLALIVELVPIATTALDLVNRIREVVAQYKEELKDEEREPNIIDLTAL